MISMDFQKQSLVQLPFSSVSQTQTWFLDPTADVDISRNKVLSSLSQSDPRFV